MDACNYPRAGFGYDSHVFEDGRRLVLCGVEVPGCAGLKAHSDGDAPIHALIDALLGAAALGDIGSHFPDKDERWRGADSKQILARTVGLLRDAGWRPWNADVTIVCEKPKIAPFAAAMRESLASVLNIEPSSVSVKGKTNEGMDAVGAGRGLAAYAAVSIAPIS